MDLIFFQKDYWEGVFIFYVYDQKLRFLLVLARLYIQNHTKLNDKKLLTHQMINPMFSY